MGYACSATWKTSSLPFCNTGMQYITLTVYHTPDDGLKRQAEAMATRRALWEVQSASSVLELDAMKRSFVLIECTSSHGRRGWPTNGGNARS